MSRKETEKKRKRITSPLSPLDRIKHSLDLSDLDMTAIDFDDCLERFKHTFKKDADGNNPLEAEGKRNV